MRPPASISRSEAYGAEKIAPCTQTDFFNRIGQQQTSAQECVSAKFCYHSTVRSRIGIGSADQFDFARPPGLGEERLKRAEEPQARDKTFTGHGLNPVAPFDTGRLCRAEVDRRGTVGVRFRGGRRKALASHARVALRLSSIERDMLS